MTDPSPNLPNPTRRRHPVARSAVKVMIGVGMAAALLGACSSSDVTTESLVDSTLTTSTTTPPPTTTTTTPADAAETTEDDAAVEDAAGVGFELLETTDDGSLRAWVAADMTADEFDALELPEGWLKNQPRETVVSRGTFAGSPGADGVLVVEEHFGFEWTHTATVTEAGIPFGDEGLLVGSTVVKDHQLVYDAGMILPVLVSPDGDAYVMVTRNRERTTDESILPAGWSVVDLELTEDLTARLAPETTVIRTSNQDSFQGPVPGLDVAALIDSDETGFGSEAFEGNEAELTAFLAGSDTDDGAFYMVNLIRFRDVAEYPDGRESNLSGLEANNIYGEIMFTEMLPAIGAEVVYSASAPTDDRFDTVAIVRYPSRADFQSMLDDPEFQAMTVEADDALAAVAHQPLTDLLDKSE